MSKTTTRLLLKHLPKPTPSHFLSHTHTTHFSSSNFSQNPFSNFQQNSLFNHKSLQNPLTKVVQRPDLSLTPPFLGSRFINFKAPELLGTKLFNPLKANNYAKNVVSKPVNNGFVGFRFINFKASELLGTKFNQLKSNSNATKYAKSVVKKPVNAIGDVVSRYRGAVGLQIEAFWKRNSLVLWGAGGFMVCILLWRVMFGIANTFVGLSEGMAKYGFLALSSAIVAFAGLYLRSRFSINPDKVYRIAMRTLNTDAGILEVMGAPLSGTDLRAYVMSGGGVALRKFKPGFRSKRCFLIFPIRGSERKGLVSVEVKNRKGQYDIKLLAVDIPMISGPDQRIFLIGNEEEYRVGGGLISELRDPVIKAMAAVKEFEDRDEREEEEDAEREAQEAERKHQEEIERIDR